jgi:hypothetical protein
MDTSAATAPLHKGRLKKARKARLPVDLWCEILGEGERAVGQIRNLAIGGGRVVSPSAFPVKGSITVILSGSRGAPDLDLKAHVRWLALNPVEGLFELGVQFAHSGDSANRVEQILKGVLKRMPSGVLRTGPSFAKFAGGMETRGAPGQPSSMDLRKASAAEGLARLTQPAASRRDSSR